MRIVELDHSWEKHWDTFIENHPDSTCYHSRAWKAAAERGYGLKTNFLLAVDSKNEVHGVIPLFRVKGIAKTHLTNGLFGAYAQALGTSQEVRDLLMKEAFKRVHEERLQYLVFKTLDAETLPGLRTLNAWVIATLQLDSDPEKVWAALRRKIKNCVRKAQREGLTCHWGVEHLPDFYDVLSENMRAKGAPIYGLSFMRELLKASNDSGDVLVVRHRGQTVAGALTLKHRDTISIPFASSRPEARLLRPSNLMVWEVIRQGCLSGMTTLDFGRSLRSSGSLDFKLGWGARTSSQPVHIYSSRGDELSLDPKDMKWFVQAWSKVPRPITDRIGPMICKQIAGFL